VIHARLTHEELRLLRRKGIRQVVVEKTAGAHRPEPGHAVMAYAPVERDTDGQVVKKRERVRCVIVLVTDEPGRWVCEYLPGVTEKPRFLTARPGKRGDYTTEERYAMADEPECVPEQWEAKFAEDARSAEQIRDDWARRQAIAEVEQAIDRLEAVGLESDRGRVQAMRSAVRRLRNAA